MARRRCALAEKDLRRRLPRPVLQPVADAARGRLQRHGRFHDELPSARRSTVIAGWRTACRNSRARRLMSSVSSSRSFLRDDRKDSRMTMADACGHFRPLRRYCSLNNVVVDDNLPCAAAIRYKEHRLEKQNVQPGGPDGPENSRCTQRQGGERQGLQRKATARSTSTGCSVMPATRCGASRSGSSRISPTLAAVDISRRSFRC